VIRLLWLVPLLPFAGAAVVGLCGRWLSRRAAAGVACASVAAAFALALGATLALSGDLAAQAGEPGVEIDLAARRAVVHVADWIAVGGEGGVRAPWRLLLDPLSAVMILVVTGVGALIHLYSIGYMAEEERGFARYFAFLNLFVGMMLLLVLGASLPVLFVGWEGVGLCSYLLIGFYYEKEWCADAGRKAFIVNRIGDAGFLLGVVTLFAAAGTLEIDALLARAASGGVEREAALAASLLLFVGAIGKSAQIPLYVWLPDAMAGPTPVSALIHAATMVTAGVYMVCRLGALFSVHPLALGVVAGIGVATALYAATIACAQTDIKKVLAYSTVSQLGYMFAGAGVGAFGAAIFHLVTHALFKAALFLGAGSVIHALHGEQEMGRMGGLRDRMPITYFTMVFGALALAGIVPFAGFFSKDEILWAALGGGHRILWIMALAGAGLTAFYVSRLVLRIFHGEPGDGALAARAHESPRVMAWPLAALGGLSVVGGLIGVPRALSMGGDWNRIGRWLAPALAGGGHAAGGRAGSHGGALAEIGAALLSLAVAGCGLYLAWALYEGRLEWARRIPERLAPLAARARAAYAVDDLYEAAVLRPYAALCAWARRIDAGAVDGMVNGVAKTVEIAGHFGRYLQTGFVRNYALFLLLGAALILYWVLP
jgi:NADH-quinone oxidoreductase subunit L